MATLATQVIALTGLNPTYASAAGGGDKCEVGDRQFLHVKNGSDGLCAIGYSSATTVTVASLRI